MEEKIDYKKFILSIVAASGILAVGLVAPNVLQTLKPFVKRRKYNPEYYLGRKVQHLIKNGLLKMKTENGEKFISLTDKGERKLDYYKLLEKKENPQKWDGKWRVVIFDVWENTRMKRDILRFEIKNFGFLQLQRSVWIYPYDCAEFIKLLKTDLAFGKNVRYLVVERLDHDERLRKRFGLRS